MVDLCKYSVLRYVPDEQREEFINIGVVLHSANQGYIDCLITPSLKRITSFDDEIDISLLKIILEGVKDDFSRSMISGPSYDDLIDFDYLDRATSTYINQLQFSRINLIKSSDFQNDLENLFKTYVHFEVQKKSRLTDQEVRSIMNRVIKLNNSKFDPNHLMRSVNVDIGSEKVELDFAYKMKNEKINIIKTFSFDYTQKGSKVATQVAKEWAYNFNKLKKQKPHIEDTLKTDIHNINFLTFIYLTNKNSPNIKLAMNILKEETEIHEAQDENGIKKFVDKMVEDMENNKAHPAG